MVMAYQYIGALIGVVGLIYTILRFRQGKMSMSMFLIWDAVWIIITIISIIPESTIIFARITGIGRGLDLVFILAIIGCYYLIFRIYNMIENIEQEITHLVREIALQNENIKIEKSEDEKDSKR